MKTLLSHRVRATFAALAVAGLLGGTSVGAADQPAVEIPVMLPLSGPAAGIGQELQKSLQVLQGYVNDTGGIRKRSLHFAFLDDQGSPQVAVQLMNQLKTKDYPAVLGGAFSAICKSIMPLVAQSGPVLYCLSPAVVPPAGSYVFSIGIHPANQLQALFRFFRERGWDRIAFLISTDASGDEADQNLRTGLQLPENRALTDVAHERFNPADISVAAQVTRIKAANPQAVVLWGAPVIMGTALHAVNDVGLDVPIAVAESIMTYNFMDQLSSFLPRQLYFASSLWNAEAVLPAAPQRNLLQNANALFRKAGIPFDVYLVVPWDAAMIVVDSLRAVGPRCRDHGPY